MNYNTFQVEDKMLKINSLETFKSCYIAYVKEKMGLKVRRSPNRKYPQRVIKPNSQYEYFITKAIKELLKIKKNPTYKDIQKKALEIYKNDKEKIMEKIKKYEGVFSIDNVSKEEALEIFDSEGIEYEEDIC